ncbi:unnamed protein product, partial [Allacma fusca]
IIEGVDRHRGCLSVDQS